MGTSGNAPAETTTVVLAEPEHPSFGWGRVAIPAAVLAVTAVLTVVWWAPESNVGFASGAAALTMVTAVAVGIERSLELFWSVIDSRAGGWWPLNAVTERIHAVEERTQALFAATVKGPLVDALNVIRDNATGADADVVAVRERATELLDLADKRVTQLAARVEDASKLAPGSPRLEIVRRAKSETLDIYTKVLTFVDQLDDAARNAQQVVNTVADHTERLEEAIETFSDNPARRVFSMFAGALIGLLVAGFLGLNLFLAVAESENEQAGEEDGTSQTDTASGSVTAAAVEGAATDTQSPFDGDLGIVLTGIIMGLGANPTHEVIKALQRRKQRDTAAAHADDGAESTVDATPVRNVYTAYTPAREADTTALERAYLQRRTFRPTE